MDMEACLMRADVNTLLHLRTEVFVWGRGEYGRLGLGDRSGSSRLRAMQVKAMEGHCVVQVSNGILAGTYL